MHATNSLSDKKIINFIRYDELPSGAPYKTVPALDGSLKRDRDASCNFVSFTVFVVKYRRIS